MAEPQPSTRKPEREAPVIIDHEPITTSELALERTRQFDCLVSAWDAATQDVREEFLEHVGYTPPTALQDMHAAGRA